MTNHVQTIHDELTQFILKHYVKGEAPADFGAQFDLIGSGILTSLALVNLISHMETQYAFELGEEDIAPENFETIDALAQLIQRRCVEI